MNYDQSPERRRSGGDGRVPETRPDARPSTAARITVTLRDGSDRMIEAAEGVTIMEAIRAAGIDELMALCGGCCSCATCHVFVAARWTSALPPMDGDEDDLLDASAHRGETSRLSCQLIAGPALDGLRVTIAPDD
jgi:2Fe-2S ferredoxin